MEERKLLIVGIDPGITTGFAVLDIEGSLIHLSSSKQFELRRLIFETMNFGKAVLVGTDKFKIPGLVQEFATKLGARIISPREDLKVNEKKAITSNFDLKDEHEGDALASALLAYKESKPLLDKIDAFAEENKKQGIRNKIKELVILKKISIKHAASIIEKKDEDSLIVEKAISERKFEESHFLKLYEKLKRRESEISLIKRYNAKLREKIASMEKQLDRKEAKIENKRLPDYRESRIRFLENSLKLMEKSSQNLREMLKRYNRIFSNLGNFYVLKKLDTLGAKEFAFKNKTINVQKNDMLLADNPNIFSKEVIGMLKEHVLVIAYKKQISKKIENELPFVFINANNLNLEEGKYFAFAEKKAFDAEKSKSDWVMKIVNDYKREKELMRQVTPPYG